MEDKFENLNSFQAEIAALKQEEEESGKSPTAHFKEWKGVEFNPAELTEDDLEIWGKTKDESLTEEDFHAYREKLMEEDRERNSSRKMFLAFIANKATSIFGLRYLEKNK